MVEQLASILRKNLRLGRRGHLGCLTSDAWKYSITHHAYHD
jgi:hypothetical protein